VVAEVHDHENEDHQTRAEPGLSDRAIGKQGGGWRNGLDPILDGCSQMHSDGLTTTYLSPASTGRIVEWHII
jgi:hypothetical protein